MNNEKQYQRQLRRIEELIQAVEGSPDSGWRASTQELMRLIIDFHGAAIDRMMELIVQTEGGQVMIDNLGRDEQVGSLLLLHGLHPADFETRVMQALDKVRPYLRSHGGNVDLLGVQEGHVRLRLVGSCHGCPSSAMTLKLAIEEAIYEAAPDVTAIDVEGVVDLPAAPANFIPVERLTGSNGTGRAQSLADTVGWGEVHDLESLMEGSARVVEVDGRPILFCRLGTTFYAYSPICSECGQSLHEASIESTTLLCPRCAQGFDVVQAGQALGIADRRLNPLPLLVEEGRARVALAV